jgi:hypothetical protein
MRPAKERKLVEEEASIAIELQAHRSSVVEAPSEVVVAEQNRRAGLRLADAGGEGRDASGNGRGRAQADEHATRRRREREAAIGSGLCRWRSA